MLKLDSHSHHKGIFIDLTKSQKVRLRRRSSKGKKMRVFSRRETVHRRRRNAALTKIKNSEGEG